MRTITKEIYKFEELKEEVKEKVKEKYYNDIGYEDNNDHFQELANQILYLLGFKESKVAYSLSFCQGDGFTFSFKLYSSDIIKNLNLYKENNPKEAEYQALKEIHNKLAAITKDIVVNNEFINKNDIIIYTETIDNRYTHKYTKKVEIESNEENYSAYTLSLQEAFKHIYYTICDYFEKLGYEWIYDEMSNDDFAELSDCNNWEYDEEGNLV